LLLHGLLRLGVVHFAREFYVVFAKIGIANAVMVVVLWALQRDTATWLAWNDWVRVGNLSVVCLAGGAAYLLALWLLGLRLRHFKA
jgi:putative peptidoglycan lipid II flippase